MQQPEHLLRAETPALTARRLLSVGAVVVFHLVVIWAFATGLAQHLITKTVEQIKVEVVKEHIDQKPPPPPPPPDLVKPPPPFVPPPTIVIQPDQAPTNTITTTTVKPPPQAVEKPAITSPASIGRPHECSSSYYPPIALRLGQEGTTTVSFKILPDGTTTDPKVTESSGHDSLDEAALRCVGGWHYKPAMQNGAPVETNWSSKVIWKIPS